MNTHTTPAPLVVCAFGIYDPRYPRNHMLLKGLRERGVEVIECQADPNARGRYRSLARQLRAVVHRADVIYAMYPSPTAAVLAKLIAPRTPLVVDAFFSMYDAIVYDRQTHSRWHPKALKLLLLDWLSLKVADGVVVDTTAHKEYWQKWKGLRGCDYGLIPIGSDPELFVPQGELPTPVTITFHGTYIPLQGIDIIVRAFALLKDDAHITFRMVGDGQEFPRVSALIADLGMEERIEIVRRVPYDAIPAYLAASEIVLGVFGAGDKPQRAVVNKVYEGLAAQRAVITMDTPAVREMFADDEVCRVERTPEALAAAIRTLASDDALRDSFAMKGAHALRQKYSPQPIGALLHAYLMRVVGR